MKRKELKKETTKIYIMILSLLFLIKKLGRILDKKTVQPFIEVLEDESESVREDAIKVLGELGDIQTIEVLIEKLKEHNNNLRKYVVVALGLLGDQRVAKPLIQCLKQEQWWDDREYLVKALGKIVDKQSAETLEEMLMEIEMIEEMVKRDSPFLKVEFLVEELINVGELNYVIGFWDERLDVFVIEIRKPELLREFSLNEGLHKVNLSILSMCKNLLVLDLIGDYFDLFEIKLPYLGNCINLREVHIPYFGDQETFRPLEKCVNLEFVYLKAKEEGIYETPDLTPLKNWKKLKILALDFEGVSVNELDLAPLQSCINLEYLLIHVGYYCGEKFDLSSLKYCKNLEVVNLKELDFQDAEFIDITPLFNCKKLKEFHPPSKEIELVYTKNFISENNLPKGLQCIIHKAVFRETKKNHC